MAEAFATSLQDKSADVPEVNIRGRPWTWSDAIWHYDDGTSVVYPGYDRIDWKDQ